MSPSPDAHPLDNPTWHALTGPQAGFAEGDGHARRFRSDVSGFGAVAEDSREAWTDLAAVAGGSEVMLNRAGVIEAPPDWTCAWSGSGFQMVLHGEPPAVDVPGTRPLDDDDVQAMLDLIALTTPGPFRRRTIELGGYSGIFEDDRLVAMAGRRIALHDFVEISAVCTHPDARRRGYAAAITSTVARGVQADGRTPILHVATGNLGAAAVYERLGFVTRTTLTFAIYRPPSSE